MADNLDYTDVLQKNLLQEIGREPNKRARAHMIRALTHIACEFQLAKKQHPAWTTQHHGFACTLEELEEAWAEIKGNNPEAAGAEFVQVGACAVRFLIDTCF